MWGVSLLWAHAYMLRVRGVSPWCGIEQIYEGLHPKRTIPFKGEVHPSTIIFWLFWKSYRYACHFIGLLGLILEDFNGYIFSHYVSDFTGILVIWKFSRTFWRFSLFSEGNLIILEILGEFCHFGNFNGIFGSFKGCRGILIILKIKRVFGDFENFKDNFIILELLVIQ